MSALPAAAPELKLDGTLGDIQIGLVLATWLFGIMTLQTFNYYRFWSWGILFHPGTRRMYSITVTFYGQPQHIGSPPLSLVFPIFFNSLIAVGVQTFFVYRVRVLSGRWLIPVICCTLNAAHLGCNMLLFVELLEDPTIGPVVDIILLVYYLWHHRKTEFKQTSRIVDTLVIWTVETTLITTISGAMQLILFLARRHDLSWLVFSLIQAKLFSNSMLASLHGRRRFRDAAATGSNVLTFGSSAAHHPGVVIPMQQLSDTVYDRETFCLRPSDKEDS
ncbi:hypothetical protein DFH06DRAFT_1473646 [Mycena polygramma]|nr:hypothetical protein DFH06DRAFT_1473646 [Mycena polygramma]